MRKHSATSVPDVIPVLVGILGVVLRWRDEGWECALKSGLGLW